jgi:WD40 repeat protein
MNPDSLAVRIGNLLGSSPSSGAEKILSRPPPPIPNHEIIAHIGGGSYGEVWLARSATSALRAVKVVWRCQFSSERPYEREFRGIVRFEPISRSHPAVVHVLHVGRDDAAGCFFYVMELADDAHGESERLEKGENEKAQRDTRKEISSANYQPRTLAAELKSRSRLPVSDAVSLGVQLAGALGHLHRHGLVHRDVKPSNVIFVQGQPKLADIGLVTGVHEERSFVGTEGFIPPEGPGSERADLFALGRLLYEAATGKDRCEFPGLPDDLDRWPHNDREGLIELNEVLARACASEAKKRHNNAAELAGDLNLILAGRSVRRAYRVERQLHRATLVSVVALVLVFAAVFSNWLQRRQRELANAHARREASLRQEAQKSLARAQAAERAAQRQLYTALFEQACATVRSGELGQRVRALDAIRRAAQITNTIELQREALAALALPDLEFERELPTGADCTMVSLDPKFERLAIGRGTKPVEIRSVSDQRLLATLPASSIEFATFGKWSANGRFFGVCRRKSLRALTKNLEIWDVNLSQQRLLRLNTPWDAFSFHPTQPRVLCPAAENLIVLYDLESGQELKTFYPTGAVHHVEFAPDGETFLCQHRVGANEYQAGAEWYTSIYDVNTGTAVSSAVTGWIDGIAWHREGRWIAFAARTGEVHLHDRRTGTTTILGRHKQEARTALFSPDGGFLFTGGEEQEIICWDLRSMQRAFTIGLQTEWLQFRADGEECAVPTKTGVLLYRFERSRPCREMKGDLIGGVNRGAISPDGRWLAAGGTDRLGLWDLTRDAPAATAKNLFNPPTPVFSPDSSELLVFWREGIFRWRMTGGDADAPPEVTLLPIHNPGPLHSVGFFDNTLMMGTGQGVRLMRGPDIASGPGEGLFILGLARGKISANGLWVAFRKTGPPRELVYRLNPWQETQIVPFEADLLAEAFTPRSDELAVATHTSVTFLDTNRWEPLRRFSITLDRNAQIIFRPDGDAFWLVHDARTAVLHDTRTFETLLPLPAGTIPLAFSPDGRHLAVSVDARRVQVWDLEEMRRQLHALGLKGAGISSR